MTNANPLPSMAAVLATFTKSMHDHWRLFSVEGIVLIVLGFAAIVVPPVASLAIEIFLGWLFLISGVFGFTMTVLGRNAPGFWWSLLSAIATIAVGVILLGWPLSGVISLTFVLSAFLLIDGVLTLLFAFEHRRQLSKRWGWMLLNGLLDLGLAGLIFWALPNSAMWALGIIIGIDMLFGGFSLISMALAARDGKIPTK